MRKFNRKILTALFLAVFLSMPLSASAAIAVIDSQNIAQQLKTYLESVKVVANTAEQIVYQLKELMSLPQTVLNAYKNSLDNSVKKVTEIANGGGFLSDDNAWGNWWQTAFPQISDSGNESFWDERNAKVTMQEMLSIRNKSDVDSYHSLMKELEESKERLKDLLELNMSPEGAKQTAQIGNQIAAEKAHIESINALIQALAVQNQTMNNNASVMQEKNHQAAANAAAKANSDLIDSWHSQLQSNWRAPAIDDPWSKYGGYGW